MLGVDLVRGQRAESEHVRPSSAHLGAGNVAPEIGHTRVESR